MLARVTRLHPPAPFLSVPCFFMFPGERRLLRCDLAMDVGRSMNPAIDIGQASPLTCCGRAVLRRAALRCADMSAQLMQPRPPAQLVLACVLA